MNEELRPQKASRCDPFERINHKLDRLVLIAKIGLGGTMILHAVNIALKITLSA
jgi:hypothetical protein